VVGTTADHLLHPEELAHQPLPLLTLPMLSPSSAARHKRFPAALDLLQVSTNPNSTASLFRVSSSLRVVRDGVPSHLLQRMNLAPLPW
jgi:hypothetical protein